jgi:hypothetical protein
MLRHSPSTVVVLLFMATGVAFAALPADKVPDFKVRFRLRADGEMPKDGYRIALQHSTKTLTAVDGQWSDRLEVGREDVKAALDNYPNSYSNQWPVMFLLFVSPVRGIVHVETEGEVEGKMDRGTADINGSNLGLAVWRDEDGTAHVTTLGSYNRLRYWSVVERLESKGKVAEKIHLADRFIPGDSDLTALKDGYAGLRKLGMNVLLVEAAEGRRELAWQAGFRKITWAIYNPPGYAFDFGGDETSEVALRNWASGLRKEYERAGFSASDFAMYVISDEPGFYYPAMYRTVNENPLYLARFHEYLRQRNLKPEDLGAKSWDEVRVIGRKNGGTLPERRLFYWSQRFFPWESARHFSNCRRAMEEAFYAGIPLVVNWNFFSGRCYFPGPFAHNPDKKDPNAAMAGHDWFEFARAGGTTTPWTEDWFGDENSFQWSYYSDKLRSASPTGRFGGYVIPRVAGAMPDGVMYKVMSLVAHGAKEIKFFTFGPEYSFPGNCYSENTRVFDSLARTSRLIGAAEDLLYPGEPPRPQVGMLHHLSAEMWDQTEMEIADGIFDATNTNMNGHCAEYTAELYDLYLALMHTQTPVRFLSEDDLTWAPLDDLKVIYVVEPNVPEEAQKRLAEWVQAGGVLVTTSRAATADRYNEPATILDEVRGVIEAPRDRMVLANLQSAKHVGKVGGPAGAFDVYGVKGAVELKGAEVLAKFDDGSAAITSNKFGKGRAVHFAFLPGLSYRRSAEEARGKFPTGWSEAARKWLNLPIELAKVEKPVICSVPLLETPVLASSQGLAITLLNWTGAPLENVSLRVQTNRPVDSVRSVKLGKLKYKEHDGFIEIKVDADTVDVVMVRYEAEK